MGKWVEATTIYPFIFYRHTEALTVRATRRHEWQHVSQVRTHGWFRFYANYLLQRLHGYMTITWEVDAYAHQNDQAWPANVPDHPLV
jgi:hypothetical protein